MLSTASTAVLSSTRSVVQRWGPLRAHGAAQRLSIRFGTPVIVAASTICLASRRSRAARDGAAAAMAEDGKRLRYPGPNLAPFVVEFLGRPGEDAKSLLRSFAPSDPVERAHVLGSAWQTLSVLIQAAHAEQLLSAVGAGR